MGKPIFINMRNDKGVTYDSYTDYWRMIDLSGFSRCELSEIDFESDNIYLYSPSNGNADATFTQEAAKTRKCKIILINLERPRWEDGILKGCEVPDFVDEMWICDRQYFEWAKMFNPGKEKIGRAHV